MSDEHGMTKEEKTIRRYFPEWRIFGEHPTQDAVDVSNGEGDVWESIPRDAAEKLIKARSDYTNAIVKVCLEYGYEEGSRYEGDRISLDGHLTHWVIESRAM